MSSQYIEQTHLITKINSYQILKLLHVSAPRCHPEGVTEQRIISAKPKSGYYNARAEMFIKAVKIVKYIKICFTRQTVFV